MSTLSQSQTMLDHTSYPHLLDLIISYASTDTYPTLRATSRTLRDRTDRALVRHLAFHQFQPLCCNEACNRSHAQDDGKVFWSGDLRTPGLQMIPVCTHLVAFNPMVSKDDTLAFTVSPESVHASRQILQHTLVLDATSQLGYREVHELDKLFLKLHTLRVRPNAHGNASPPQLNDPAFCVSGLRPVWTIPVPRLCRRVIIFPTIEPLVISPSQSGRLEKLVFHLQWNPQYCFPLAGRSLAVHHPDLAMLQSIVVIFHRTVRNWALPRSLPASSPYPDPIELPAVIENGACNVLWYMPGVHITFVDAHRYVNQGYETFSTSTEGSVRAALAERLSAVQKARTVGIEAVEERVSFITMEEYRATISEEDFELEMVEM